MRHQLQTPANQLHSASPRHAGTWRRATSWTGGPEPQSSPICLTTAPTFGARAAEPESDNALARLEAILFLAREPINSRKLSQYANLADGTQARTLVRRLNDQYDATGRAFRIENVAGGFQLLTRQKLAPWLRRLAHVPGETRLSAPALETLAVIAYRQPVPRADIEAVRGVNCGEILRQLMDRDLVRIGGRSQELGRPYLYATTRRFLELFGLNHIDELPRGQELRASPLPTAPLIAPLFSPDAASPEVASPDAESPGGFTEPDEPVIDETESESTFG